MRLASLDRSKIYTSADYAKWDFPERVELMDGKIYEMMSAPGLYHQEISLDIASLLRNFLRSGKCKVYSAPVDVYLPGS